MPKNEKADSAKSDDEIKKKREQLQLEVEQNRQKLLNQQKETQRKVSEELNAKKLEQAKVT